MTQSYERLHATVSLVVLHGGSGEHSLEMPGRLRGHQRRLAAGFPVGSGRRRAEHYAPRSRRPKPWCSISPRFATARRRTIGGFPQLTVKNVESQAAVIGLLLEDRLQAKNIAASSLVPIDTSVLTASIPPSVMAAGPGLPAIRPVVAYYAPHEAFSFAAAFERPQSELLVTSSVLLTVADSAHKAEVNLSLVPRRAAVPVRSDRALRLASRPPRGAATASPLTLERYAEAERRHAAASDAARRRGRSTCRPTSCSKRPAFPPAGSIPGRRRPSRSRNFKVAAADRADGAIAHRRRRRFAGSPREDRRAAAAHRGGAAAIPVGPWRGGPGLSPRGSARRKPRSRR